MPRDTTTTRFSLPADDDVVPSEGRIGAEQSVASSLIVLIGGLIATSSNQPKAELLFIGAGIVIIVLYFVVPLRDNENTHPVVSTFLQRVPDVFTAFGCILIVLGVGNAFPNETALIPLFSFISFAALAALFSTMLAAWTAAVLYSAALASLVAFVVLAFMA